MTKKFNTYLHRRKDTNEVFYIGEGNKKRPFSDTVTTKRTSNRSKEWYDIKEAAGGVIIEVIAVWDTKQEAIQHETLLIDCFKSSPLINKNKGGSGGPCSDETRVKLKQILTGKKKHAAFGAKISKALSGTPKKKYTCNKCNQEVGGLSNLNRWHNDNCKK